MIEVTQENLTALETSYNEAVEAKLAEFTFMNKPMLTSYAKYAIEYMRTILC